MDDRDTSSPRSLAFQLRLRGTNIPDEDLLSDLRRVAESGHGTLSAAAYTRHGKHAAITVAKRFGSWNDALLKAGLPINNEVYVSDERLFENLERVWTSLGRQPGRRDLTKPVSEFTDSPYTRRFGLWNKALTAFIGYINQDDVPSEDASARASSIDIHRTGRDINLRMRFRVLQRDRFTCKSCGRSPATHMQVVLHVDHVLAWSRGGETELQNLQTLCSDCNLGKGNMA